MTAARPTPAPETGAPADLGTALQAVLADEHAAIYGYGALAVHLSGPQRAAATAAYDIHRARRDILICRVEAIGDRPVAAAPAYGLPFPLMTEADATRLAAQLEQRLGNAYADLVQASSADARRTALEWLTDSAVRAVRWSGTSLAFPGLPERD